MSAELETDACRCVGCHAGNPQYGLHPAQAAPPMRSLLQGYSLSAVAAGQTIADKFTLPELFHISSAEETCMQGCWPRCWQTQTQSTWPIAAAGLQKPAIIHKDPAMTGGQIFWSHVSSAGHARRCVGPDAGEPQCRLHTAQSSGQAAAAYDRGNTGLQGSRFGSRADL